MITKGVPYSWEISHPDGNDEGTDISRYSSLGAPDAGIQSIGTGSVYATKLDFR